MTRTFLGLEHVRSEDRTGCWALTVTPQVATSSKFLFGGAALAGAVTAMEDLSGRQLAWATAQYLDYALLGQVVEYDVTLEVVGNQITQAKAFGRVGDREIITVVGALGAREFVHHRQFEFAPDVPRPDELPKSSWRPQVADTIHEKFDQRYVIGRGFDERDGTPSDGRTVMWVRIPDLIEGVDAATLAVLGDFVPLGVGQSLGVLGGGNSLDNTLRVVQLVPTTWVLIDMQIHAVERGFGHGSLKMFAEDGTLIAVASQTCIARLWKDRK